MRYFRNILSAALLLSALSLSACQQSFVVPLVEPNLCTQVETACKTLEGAPYVWGGTSVSGTDCSGAVYYVAKRIGKPIPRITSKKLWISIPGPSIPWQKAECGYLAWWGFSHSKPYGHVGIVVEDDSFWQAGSSTGFVRRVFESGQFWDITFNGSKKFLTNNL